MEETNKQSLVILNKFQLQNTSFFLIKKDSLARGRPIKWLAKEGKIIR